ncbi:MAG: response regulator transcription factor [Roseburia sp.]|nr:response regulator transcription factor [Roseburia sp.]
MTEKEKVYRIVLCDDDAVFMEIMEEKIKKCLNEEKMPFQLRRYLHSCQMTTDITQEDDLYFLDIDMPGVSGMELAKAILRENPQGTIIFVSNHEEMVFEAIRYMPFRFIRKDRLEEELHEALLAWEKKIVWRRQKLEVKTRDGMVCVPVDEVLYLESHRHYIRVCCTSREYEMRGKLSDYEENLKHWGFVRVNVGYLVNCRHISVLRAGQVILSSKEEISIGRARREEVKRAYMKFVREDSEWR